MPAPAKPLVWKFVPARDGLPLLESGDRLDQKTFHALYEQTPPGFKAELLGGVVYVASPTSSKHGFPHARVVTWLGLYSAETPGTEVGDNTTNILGDDSEPQPDACLIVLPGYGGQTTIDRKGYLRGPAELVAEVASSSVSIDLGAKRADYERAGVREYVVFLCREERVVWFVRRDGAFVELAPGEDGIYRSRTFPGLWLNPTAFFGRSVRKTLDVARAGRQSPEHVAFLADLRARRRAKRKPNA